MSPNRRRFLAGVLVGITALGTGCVGSSGSGDEPTPMPKNGTSLPTITNSPVSTTVTTSTSEPSSTSTPSTSLVEEVPVREPLASDGSLQRLSSPIDEVRYGSLSGFRLTASEETVALGETVTFRLENTTGAEKLTGNKRKYDIQRSTDGGWQSIYWVEAEMYTDVGVSHRPDEGFTWTFPFTRNDLEQSTRLNTPYSVCGPIPPGEYRFIYWGVTSEAERKSDFEKEYAIGVRFTVVQP